MAVVDIESVIKKGVERALNEPIMNGKSVMQWAEIGIHSQEQPQWISVKDRLPPNADHPGAFCPRYLVCTDFGITVGWYNPDKGKWYGCGWWMYDTNRVADVDFERGDIPKRVVLPVEAWMPLPEPPEVRQDGIQ